MELAHLGKDYDQRTSDKELDRRLDEHAALASIDNTLHEDMMAKVSSLPTTSKLLRKAHEQHLEFEGRMQEEKEGRAKDREEAQAVKADLERYCIVI